MPGFSWGDKDFFLERVHLAGFVVRFAGRAAMADIAAGGSGDGAGADERRGREI